MNLSRRQFLAASSVAGIQICGAGSAVRVKNVESLHASSVRAELNFENRHFRLLLDSSGRCLEFSDRATRRNYCVQLPDSFFAEVRLDSQRRFVCSLIERQGDHVRMSFGGARLKALLGITVHE